MTIGSQPAENRSKRTSGTRAAGLRRAEAAARRRFATSLTLELQLTKHTLVRVRIAGLCGERVPPTGPQRCFGPLGPVARRLVVVEVFCGKLDVADGDSQQLRFVGWCLAASSVA